MSSHHIVREDQEPALIIDEIGAVSSGLFLQLLEWSPTVIIHASQLESVRAFETKVDVLFSERKPRILQDNVVFRESSPEAFAFEALRYLVDKHYTAAYLLTTERNIGLIGDFFGNISITVMANGKRYYAVRSGFSKWKPEGERITLFKQMRNLAVSGLVRVGDDTYDTTEDGFFELTFSGEYGIIGETL